MNPNNQGDWRAEKLLGLEGRVSLLNQEKEDLAQSNQTLIDLLTQEKANHQTAETALTKEKADHKITKKKSVNDSKFHQALQQVKTLYPELDISACDALKEVVDGAFINLISDEEGPETAIVEKENEKIGGSQAEVINEHLGNAPCN
ncbi:F-box/kelch-repeat protein [Sesbania bispinosa]|nr:F-box/kelch-repeat protein [Sesbania bispinosa]